MLELDSVEIWRGASRAVQGIDLVVRAGEIVALLGANGAGKTTTLLGVSGLLRPRRGRIRLAGEGGTVDLQTLSPDRIVALGVAHCPEGRQVFGSLSVRQNLLLGAYLRRDRDGIAQDLARLERRFPILGERRDMAAGQLSGGEQMMLAIGRALMSRPRLLMLDEPSLGLAPRMVEEIFDIVVELNRAGTTVLLVEQNASMALDIAHRAYVLETGRIILSGPAAELARDDAVRRSYLGMEVGS
jgi:branched-chain amino acid transport system ATP-binding protein